MTDTEPERKPNAEKYTTPPCRFDPIARLEPDNSRRGQGNAHHFRRFALANLAVIDQLYGALLVVAQFGHSDADDAIAVSRLHQRLGIFSVIFRLGNLIQTRLRPPFTHNVNAAINGYAIQPCGHFGLPALPMGGIFPDRSENILRRILAILPITQSGRADFQNIGKMPVNQNMRGVLIAAANFRHEPVIIPLR